MQTADGGSRDNYRDREAPAVRRPADAVDLLAVFLALAVVHFGAPMAYHVETKRWLKRPWDVKRGVQHTLTVTVVIPTYNEARHIEEKFEDIYRQDCPRDRLEIFVVDSASSDGTAEKARRWAQARPDAYVKVVEEPERRGKASAINTALAMARGEVFVITDADCRWPQRDALRRAVSWLADPAVGAVTCLKKPAADGPAGVEAVPPNGYHRWRTRRAQHRLPHFLKTPAAEAPPPMRPILLAEKHLHLANPWLLPAAVAAVKNLRDKGLVWEKQEK